MSATAGELREDRLRSLLREEPFVRELVVMGRVESTNDELRSLAARGAEPGTVVLAHEQSRGRGRRGHSWHSPRSLGLYLSVLFRPVVPPQQLTRWTLATSVAACEACRQMNAGDVVIRWPNDLLWQRRKLGGILAEMRGGDGPSELVVGIGLNVLQEVSDFPEALAASATSLRLAAGGTVPDREMLAALCLRGLARLSALLDHDGWGAVARRWEELAPQARGARVRVVSRSAGAAESYEGVTLGLDPNGALLVRRAGGEVESVCSVDSVLPLEEESCS